MMQRIQDWIVSWVETLAVYTTPGMRVAMREADEDIRNGDLVPFEPGDIGCPGLDDFRKGQG